MLNNKEIEDKLEEINKLSICNQKIALKKFNKEYKHSSFYKTTHYSLDKLFLEYKVESILSLKKAFDNFQNMINNIDGEHLATILDESNLKTKKEIDATEKAFQDSGLEDILKTYKK